MALAFTGANARLYIKQQTDLVTRASGNYLQVPFLSWGLVGSDEIADDPVLGYGRSPQRPARDAFSVAGRVVVPADHEAIGWWLKLLLGAPTTASGVHTYQDGDTELPFFSAEIAHADGSVYRQYTGVAARSGTFTLDSKGRPRLELDCVAVDEVEAATSGAGTPSVIVPTWFHHKQSALKKDGTALARIGNLSLTVDNGLETALDIGSQGKVAVIAAGMSKLTGQLDARFTDSVLYGIARDAAVFDLELGWVQDADRKLLIELDQAELTRKGAPVQGGGIISQGFGLLGSKDFVESGAQALRVTLANGTSSYA